MRQALNENRTVQLIVLGVLTLLVGLLFISQMGGGGGAAEEPTPVPAGAAGASGAGAGAAVGGDSAATAPADTSSAAAAATPATGAAAPVDATTAGAAPPPATTPGPAPTAGSVPPEALVPGPGLPAPVVQAFARGNAVVILIVRNRGIDDRLVRQSVEGLKSIPGVSVFTARAKNVARYSRITQGVGVTQVPALIVVRPRPVSGGIPQAQVSYGFRKAQSVVQAVKDALYQGRDDLPYHPG